MQQQDWYRCLATQATLSSLISSSGKRSCFRAHNTNFSSVKRTLSNAKANLLLRIWRTAVSSRNSGSPFQQLFAGVIHCTNISMKHKESLCAPVAVAIASVSSSSVHTCISSAESINILQEQNDILLLHYSSRINLLNI